MPKVILISGGSDGLGKAIAKKLAPNNQVIILAHNKIKLEAAAKEIGCDYIEAELTDYRTLESAVKEIIKEFHAIDILINNAGVWTGGQLDEVTPEKINQVIGVNTTGTIYLTKAVLPYLISQKSGHIINIISRDGLRAKKDRAIYSASKWAITGFTKCLQEDLEETDIKVTGIYPGPLKTSLFAKNGVNRDLSSAMDPEEVASLIESVINLSPNTRVQEIEITNKKSNTQNMDDSTAPAIDLNIDPNMIAAQDDVPQAAPGTTPFQAPVAPIAKNPNVIDITPGSTDVFPTSAPAPTHIDTTPLAESKSIDITPQIEAADSLSHLSDIAPEPEMVITPEPAIEETVPESTPDITPEATPVAPEVQSPVQAPAPVWQAPTTPFAPTPAPVVAPTVISDQAPAPVAEVTPVSPAPVSTEPAQPVTEVQASPLAEDPDLVKLIK